MTRGTGSKYAKTLQMSYVRALLEGRKEGWEDKCIFYIQIAVSNRKAGGGGGREREGGRAPLAERIHNKFQMSARLELLHEIA